MASRVTAGITRIIIVLICIVPAVLNAAPTQEPEEGGEYYNLVYYLDYLEDTKGRLTIKDVRSFPASEQFIPNKEEMINLGMTGSAHWLRIKLLYSPKNDESRREWLLNLAQSQFDYLELYLITPEGISKTVKTGDKVPFGEREIKHHNFIFSIPLKAHEKTTIYIRIKMKGWCRIPISLETPLYFNVHQQEEFLGYGLFYGILLIIFLYNVFIFCIIRDRNYFYYILFVVGYTLFSLAYDGFGFQYLWPNIPFLTNEALPFFIGFSMVGIIFFCRSFLNIKEILPFIDLVLLYCAGFFVLGTGLVFLLDYLLVLKSVLLLTACTSGILVITAYYLLFKRFRITLLYMVFGWTVYLVCLMMLSMGALGFIPHYFIVENGHRIGIVMGVVFFSFALASRIRETELEKSLARREATELLKKKVLESNRELQDAYERLSAAYSEMKEDLLLAKIIQDKILPRNIDEIDGLYFHIEYLPLIEIGGDFYDIYKMKNGVIRIFLADAVGHGIVASLITMLIKSEYEKIKGMEEIESDPLKAMKAFNSIFVDKYSDLNLFFTGILMDIDLENGKIVYFSAGHPTQYLAREGQLIELPRTGRVVGVLEEIKGSTHEIDYQKGDKILLFTDGLFEEFNQDKKIFGEDRAREVIVNNSGKPIVEIIDLVIEEMIDFVDESELFDDITVIGIE
ncbi:MAG: SpoIIE family protein phosphatase [bacterium]|nr:SpoIIE family protein phosphatase [bacterium]